MLQATALIELVICWLSWIFVFVVRQRRPAGGKPTVTAPVAKWGGLLQGLGYAVAWSYLPRQDALPVKPAGFLVASMVIGPASVALALHAVAHLGRHWRIPAALVEDHELVQTGPYRWLRHPIYASMLGMLLATGFAWSRWWQFLIASVIFIAGTEIRVRAEDRLLAGRFQEVFLAYQARVPAYIPFVR